MALGPEVQTNTAFVAPHGRAREYETASRRDSECAVPALHAIYFREVVDESLASVLDEGQRSVGAAQSVSHVAVKRAAVAAGFTA